MGQSTIQSPQKHHNHPAVCTNTTNTTNTSCALSSHTNAAAAAACHCKDYAEPAKVSKMRVFKKIKKKFGLTKSAPRTSPNNLPPLQFHQVHGDNVRICRDGTMAKRYEGFCKGIAFSARPVKTNERVYVKFSEVSNNWNGVIRFGFTYNDPATLRNSLPKYSCPDLTDRPGFWVKALNADFWQRHNVLHYYVTAAGDVHFGINGEEKGVFITGVETRRPLWTLLDIYGNCTAVELLDARVCAHHTNGGATVVANNGPAYGGGRRADTDIDRVQSAFQSMAVNGVEEHPAAAIMTRSCSSSLNNNAANEAAVLIPVPFHRTKGRNVTLSADRYVATRAEAEFCQGYVFTARPVRIGERIIVQVLRTEHMYVGALALGLTSCDPAALQTADLPDDADMLLDRPEYWVVSKDVAATPNRGDEIMFCVQPNGEVQVSKNRGPPTVVMHVDQSLQLWAFLDVYGSTQSVRILSQAPAVQMSAMAQQQQQQQHGMSPVRRLQVRLPTSESMNSLNSQMSMHHLQQQQQHQQIQHMQPQHQQQIHQHHQLQHHMAAQQQQHHNRHQAEMQRKVHAQQAAAQQQQQQQQQQMGCMSSATSNHMINVPTTNGDMIQIQQGGTVLVVNLPPTQHSSVSDLSTSQASLAVHTVGGVQQQPQLAQAMLHPQQQQQQQQQQQSHHHAVTVPTRIQALPAGSCSATPIAAVVPVQSAAPAAAPPAASGQSCASAYPEPVDPQNYATMSQWHDAATAAASTSANLTVGAECTICYENSIDSVLYMCGHMCMCYECAIQQWRGIGGGHCPLCRAVIRDVIRTYKS